MDLRTLIGLLRCAISPDVALHEQRVALQGDEAGFRRFVELFAWQPELGKSTSASSIVSGGTEPQF